MKRHRHIIQFKDGRKKTFHDIVDIKEGEKVHLIDMNGKEYIVNRDLVEWSEKVFADELNIIVDSTKGSCTPGFVGKIRVMRKDNYGNEKEVFVSDGFWLPEGKVNTILAKVVKGLAKKGLFEKLSSLIK